MWPYTVQEADELKATSSCPRGELAARSVAMPADTNPNGEIFGGWIMAMMDSAGMMTATQHAQGRVTTVAVTVSLFMVVRTVYKYLLVFRRNRVGYVKS